MASSLRLACNSLLPLRAEFRVFQFQIFEGVENDPGHDQLGVLFVIGRHHVPGSGMSAGGAEAGLERLHVLLPVFPLLDVGQAEFPVLLGRIDALEEAFALFFLGKMQEEFDDAGAIAVKVVLQVDNGTIPVAPDRFVIDKFRRQALGLEKLGMNAKDQNFLVVGAIEDADPAPLGQLPRRIPQEVVVQLLGAGVLETEHLAALGIDARHHVLDGAVLAGRIHRLENQQQRVTVGRVQHVLLGAQLDDVFREELLILLS